MLQKLPRLVRAADTHSAFAESQVQDLIDSAVLLHDNIGAHDADIRSAVLHIGGDVRSLCQEEAQFLLFIGEDQLAGSLIFQFFTVISRLIKELHGLVSQASLGQGYCNIVVHAILRLLSLLRQQNRPETR